MKRLFVIIAVTLIMGMAVPAIGGFHPEGKPVGWSEVTHDVTGAVLECDRLYRFWAKGRITGAVTLLGETSDLTFVPIMGGSSIYYVGVSAVGVVDGIAYDEFESPITWSDSTDEEAVPVPFGLMAWYQLQAPTGLRLVP